jgi:hypothetical protein
MDASVDSSGRFTKDHVRNDRRRTFATAANSASEQSGIGQRLAQASAISSELESVATRSALDSLPKALAEGGGANGGGANGGGRGSGRLNRLFNHFTNRAL